MDTARAHFERGYTFAQQGAFEQAIDEFELAYAASPHFSVLFNMGQAYGAAGRAVEAEHTLARYLELGGDEINAEQRGRTLALIEHYRRRIGRIALRGLPPGAAVSLDGTEQGETPFQGPFEASAGRHAVSVRALGHQPLVLAVDVKAGETSDLPVVLVPLPRPATTNVLDTRSASASAAEEARRKHAKTQKLVALGLGGGAVLTGGAAVTLAIVNSAHYADWRHDATAFMSAFRKDPSSANLHELDALLAEENAIRNRDSVAIGLGVAAGTLAFTALGLYLTAGSSAPTLSVTPRGDATVGYRGSF